MDSLEATFKVGDIPKSQVVLVNSETNPTIVLYQNYSYEDKSRGYWIGILKENKWTYYYTGLTENYPYFVKPTSRINFSSDTQTIMVEAAELKETRASGMPAFGPEYKLVKDHLVLEFSLDSLIQDSDNDSLTDIFESKLFTNKNSPDTDGDGLVDAIDNNPLGASSDSGFVKVYNYLLDNPVNHCFIPFDGPPGCQIASANVRLSYLIVSDDPDLKRINPPHHQMIVLTTREFEEYTETNTVPIVRIHVSPLSKKDPSISEISIYRNPGSSTFRVTTEKTGWDIELTSSTIH